MMRFKLCVAALCAVASMPSLAACPASDKSFANKRYQGTAEVYSGGNLVGTWTLSQLFDATGKVARGVVFKPDQPGEATSYTATTTAFDKDAQDCTAQINVVGDDGLQHSGRSTFQASGETFEYVGTTKDRETIIRVTAVRQSKCSPQSAFSKKAFACSFRVLSPDGAVLTAWTGTQVFESNGKNSKASAYLIGAESRVDFDVETTFYDPDSCTGTATTTSADGSANGSGTFTMIPGKVAGWEYVGTLQPGGEIAQSSCRLQ